MNINITLLGEMITFMIFVWFTLKFVWPPILHAIEDRQKNISNSIEQAKQAAQKLHDAQQEAQHIIQQAEEEVRAKIAAANYEGNNLIKISKEKATSEYNKILAQAKADAAMEMKKIQELGMRQLSDLTLLTAEKALKKYISENKLNTKITETIIQEIEHDRA